MATDSRPWSDVKVFPRTPSTDPTWWENRLHEVDLRPDAERDRCIYCADPIVYITNAPYCSVQCAINAERG